MAALAFLWNYRALIPADASRLFASGLMFLTFGGNAAFAPAETSRTFKARAFNAGFACLFAMIAILNAVRNGGGAQAWLGFLAGAGAGAIVLVLATGLLALERAARDLAGRAPQVGA